MWNCDRDYYALTNIHLLFFLNIELLQLLASKHIGLGMCLSIRQRDVIQSEMCCSLPALVWKISQEYLHAFFFFLLMVDEIEGALCYWSPLLKNGGNK